MESFIIAHPNFTIGEYNKRIKSKSNEDKKIIAESLKLRLIQRYITPGENKLNKSGFNIMASCCLLIETYESFYRGWSKSPSSPLAFCGFFNRSNLFKDFTGNDIPFQFYKHIRCGILHQGETTGGWRIRRDLKVKLDYEKKIIDANNFRDDLKKEIERYFDNMKDKDWSSIEWTKLKTKMNSIIKNCK